MTDDDVDKILKTQYILHEKYTNFVFLFNT